MIYQNIEFHNVVELEQKEHFSGLQMHRIPVDIHKYLTERGRWNAQMSPGSEIRCVTDSENIRLFISTLQGDGPVLVFQGDFFHSSHHVTPGKIHCIHVEPKPKFDNLHNDVKKGRRFPANVWRFMLTGFFPFFHQLETFHHDVRPPNNDEKPAQKWLAYGSSITAGAGALMPHSCYVQQAAWRLGVDVLNLAQGGACFCEPQLADFFAERGDWDFATLEIGVNMLATVPIEKFAERASYFVNTICNKNPDKKVILITPFTNNHHYAKEETIYSTRQVEYTNFLNEFVTQSTHANLHVINGREILTDFSGLTADLIHPFDTGMTQMGQNLAEKLKPLINTD